MFVHFVLFFPFPNLFVNQSNIYSSKYLGDIVPYARKGENLDEKSAPKNPFLVSL